MKLANTLLATTLRVAIAGVLQAAVSPEVAAKLGTNLTPVGAAKAGEDCGSCSVGVGMDMRNQYRFGLKYVDIFRSFDTCDAAGAAPAGGIQGEGATPGANDTYNCTVGQPTAFAGTPSQRKDRGMVTLTFKTTF